MFRSFAKRISLPFQLFLQMGSKCSESSYFHQSYVRNYRNHIVGIIANHIAELKASFDVNNGKIQQNAEAGNARNFYRADNTDPYTLFLRVIRER